MTLKQRYSTGLERLEFAASQVLCVFCNEYIMGLVNKYITSIVSLVNG